MPNAHTLTAPDTRDPLRDNRQSILALYRGPLIMGSELPSEVFNLLNPEDDWLSDEQCIAREPAEPVFGMKLLDDDLWATYREFRRRKLEDEQNTELYRNTIGSLRLQRFFATVLGFMQGSADLTGRWPHRWAWYAPRFEAVLNAYFELAKHCRVERIRNPMFSDNETERMMQAGFSDRIFWIKKHIIEPPHLLDEFAVRFGLPLELADFGSLRADIDEILEGCSDLTPRFQEIALLDLPNEVLHQIIDYLSAENQRALADCCSRLHALCNRYLYSRWDFQLRWNQRILIDDSWPPAAVAREFVTVFARLHESIRRACSMPQVTQELTRVTFPRYFPQNRIVELPEGIIRVNRRVDTVLGDLLARAQRITTLELGFLPIGVNLIKALLRLPHLRRITSNTVAVAPEALALLEDPFSIPTAASVRSFTLRQREFGDAPPDFAALGLLVCFPELEVLNMLGAGFIDLSSLVDLRPVASPLRLSLSIGGWDHELDWLTTWLRQLAAHHYGLRLTALRFTSLLPLTAGRLFARFLPSLNIATALSYLELGGVCDLMPLDVRQLSFVAPHLESLALMSRDGDRQRKSKWCQWRRPLYEYARELAGLPHLKCLFLNMDCLRQSYSPASMELIEDDDPFRWHRGCLPPGSDVFDNVAPRAALLGSFCSRLETVMFGPFPGDFVVTLDLSRDVLTGFVTAELWYRPRAEHPHLSRFGSSYGLDESF